MCNHTNFAVIAPNVYECAACGQTVIESAADEPADPSTVVVEDVAA